MKLDAEGHELQVLHGAERLLAHNTIDIIQFEFGGCNIDSRTCFQDFFYLLNPQYRLFQILRDGLFSIKEYVERHELFFTTNFQLSESVCPGRDQGTPCDDLVTVGLVPASSLGLYSGVNEELIILEEKSSPS